MVGRDFNTTLQHCKIVHGINMRIYLQGRIKMSKNGPSIDICVHSKSTLPVTLCVIVVITNLRLKDSCYIALLEGYQ